MKTQIIDELKNLEVHDVPIARFEILFEERKVIVELEEFSERDGEYYPLKLIFKKVNNVYTNNPNTEIFQCEGVFSIDYKPVDEERIEARLVIDMGPSMPVFVITVVFEEVEIERSIGINK